MDKYNIRTKPISETNWISMDIMPTSVGWYKVQDVNGNIFEAPVSRNSNGVLTWVLPNKANIKYWSY